MLRPILAANWILEKRTAPPMLFKELAEAELPDHLKDTVDGLLNLKMNSPEIKLIPRIDHLNEYMDSEIADIKSRIGTMEEERDAGWEELNQFFLKVVSEK